MLVIQKKGNNSITLKMKRGKRKERKELRNSGYVYTKRN